MTGVVDVADAKVSSAELVDLIATELNLLTYCWTAPERFLERRNDLVVQLRRLSRRMRGERQVSVDITDMTTFRSKPAPTIGEIVASRRSRTIIVRRVG